MKDKKTGKRDHIPGVTLEDASQKQDLLRQVLLDALGVAGESASLYQNLSASKTLHHFYQLAGRNYDTTCDSIARDIGLKYKSLRGRLDGNTALDEDFMRRFAAAITPYLQEGVKEQWLEPGSYQERPIERILTEKIPKGAAVIGSLKGMDALDMCIEASGVPESMIGPMLGEEYNWISISRKADHTTNLSGRDISRIAVLLTPYIAKEKKWESQPIEVTDPALLRKHEILKDLLVTKTEEKAGKPLPELREAASNNATLGALIRDTRIKLNLNTFAFKPHLSHTLFHFVEMNAMKMPKGEEVGDRLKHLVEHIACTFGERYRQQDAPSEHKDKRWQRVVYQPSSPPGANNTSGRLKG